MSYFHTFDRFGFDIHTNFDRRIVTLKFKTSKCWFCETIPVNKSSLTTIDIFQLKILANRQRINVNWYIYV